MSKEKHIRDWILRRCCGAVCACVLTLAAVVGFIVLVIYLALRPSKPSFYLQDVQLRSIDLSDPALSLNLQVRSSVLDRIVLLYLGAGGPRPAGTPNSVTGGGDDDDELFLNRKLGIMHGR